MSEATTDRPDEDVITADLIDSIIAISRVLSKRDLTSPVVLDALKDLRDDKGFFAVFCAIPTGEPTGSLGQLVASHPLTVDPKGTD